MREILQSAMHVKLSVIDSIIAAIALENNLKLVTRNVEDFRFIGIPLINPWV